MTSDYFENRKKSLITGYESLVTKPNRAIESTNGIYERYENPVLTRDHIPLAWRYDFNRNDNPYLMERMAVNSTFNSGAIEWNEKICLVVRVEGADRKSFFAVAESENGIDNFRFHELPVVIEPLEESETNYYDMRITAHEDGWLYGLFCVEKHDDNFPDDPSAARADCGIVRSKDLIHWERLPNLISQSQQRNVVLHPEFVSGKYALYTRPADSFIETGKGNGIGWVLINSMESACIEEEVIIEPRQYHTIKEVKNGQGPVPIKTPLGWLHIPHGVRQHACGLRYVLYVFMTDLKEPDKVLYRPGGHFLSSQGYERIGDTVCNVFCNGMVKRANGDVLIYYGGSDTRLYVVKSSVDKLLDYTINTPEDGMRSHRCVQQRVELINKNIKWLEGVGKLTKHE